jgi:two-component system alkaline phosphatase synthesis response regulator PhoP
VKSRILVIDDDEDMLLIISSILQTESKYEVDTALDPGEAYKLAQSNQYNLIISDFTMPMVNGDELFLCLKRVLKPHKNGSSPRLLLISGSVCEKKLKTRLHLDPEKQVLGKPFSGDDLLNHVKQLLADHHLEGVDNKLS